MPRLRMRPSKPPAILHVGGLDFSADRVLAASGVPGHAGQLLHLDGDHHELPLALSLESRHLEVGRAGLALCRQFPHLTCTGILQRLGHSYSWRWRRHKLDAAAALSTVFGELRNRIPHQRGCMLALPAYLTHEQVYQVARIGQESGLPVMGSLPRALAAALNSYLEHAWHNIGLVVDVDDLALTITAARAVAGDGELRCLAFRTYPALGMRVWRDRVLRQVADQCIRLCRRDPRESSEADQLLFDQFERILDGQEQSKIVLLRVQGGQWYQTLALQPGDVLNSCTLLARQTAQAIGHAIAWAEKQLTSASVFLTASAARLPGLARAVYEHSESRLAVVVLPASAPALGAFQLAQRIERGEVQPGILGQAVPLPAGGRWSVVSDQDEEEPGAIARA